MFHRCLINIFSGVIGTAVLMSFPAWGQMPPPPVGAKYTFQCSSSVNSNYEETYSIQSSDGTSVRVEVNDGIDRNWYEKPLYLLNTTMMTEESIRGQVSTMSRIPGTFRQLASLTVGGKYSGYVTERRPNDRFEWHYSVAVSGQETVYNRAFGDLKVVTINESRWVNVFSSKLDVQYAPDLAFPLSWKYNDSNGAEVDCELAAATGIAVAAVASSGAKSAPAAESTQIVLIPGQARMQALGNTNIRAQPSRQGARIGLLNSGAGISVSGYVEAGGERWYALPLDNGTTGYVFGGLLKEATAPAPAPKAAAAPAAAATKPAATLKAPAPAAAPAAATDSTGRLQQLDELLRANLITEAEYQKKRQEVLGTFHSDGVAEQLRDTNRLFRQGKINPEEFVQARADILAKINASDMDAKDGLVLLNELINERLISEAEYSRKRSVMLDAL
jgi:hypothetical protein